MCVLYIFSNMNLYILPGFYISFDHPISSSEGKKLDDILQPKKGMLEKMTAHSKIACLKFTEIN